MLGPQLRDNTSDGVKADDGEEDQITPGLDRDQGQSDHKVKGIKKGENIPLNDLPVTSAGVICKIVGQALRNLFIYLGLV